MMRKRYIIFIFIVLIVFFIALFKYIYDKKKIYFTVKESTPIDKTAHIPFREKLVFNFIRERMSSNGGVYTGITDGKGTAIDLPSGKDVLSESQGVLLLYLLNRSNKIEFNRVINYTTRYMYSSAFNIFNWVYYKDGSIADANALIDDLRILKALIYAYDKWNDYNYKRYASRILKGIYKRNVYRGFLVDYYSLKEKKRSKNISLSYLDMEAIKMAKKVNKKWTKLFNSSFNVLKNGKLFDSPFPAQSYNIDKDKYTWPEEVSLVQMIYSIINMCEAGIEITDSLEWIYGQYKLYGKLYANYSAKTKKPISDIESTALYCLASRLFLLAGDTAKAKDFINEAEKLQVLDRNSEIYGVFGDESSMQVYSFDNLQYLLVSSLLYR